MDCRGDIRLASAVLVQAALDYRADVSKARHFVQRSPEFEFWCQVAEVDPERLRKRILYEGREDGQR